MRFACKGVVSALKAEVGGSTSEVGSSEVALQVSPSAERNVAVSAGREVRIGTHTDVGRVRGNNEDRLMVYDLAQKQTLAENGAAEVTPSGAGLLLIVADGMGGTLAGETASQMCVDLLPAAYLKHAKRAVEAKDARRKALQEAVHEAHDAIWKKARSDAQYKGMGTTCTAALLAGTELCIAQVGDSRAYLGRSGKVSQLTRDQTVWETMLAASQGSKNPPAEFSNASWKNMLTQALGAQQELNVVCTETTLDPEEWLVLCTDGVYRVVKSEQMAEVLQAEGNPAQKARQLIDLANAGGGPDNCSAIVCQMSKPFAAKAGSG